MPKMDDLRLLLVPKFWAVFHGDLEFGMKMSSSKTELMRSPTSPGCGEAQRSKGKERAFTS